MINRETGEIQSPNQDSASTRNWSQSKKSSFGERRKRLPHVEREMIKPHKIPQITGFVQTRNTVFFQRFICLLQGSSKPLIYPSDEGPPLEFRSPRYHFLQLWWHLDSMHAHTLANDTLKRKDEEEATETQSWIFQPG